MQTITSTAERKHEPPIGAKVGEPGPGKGTSTKADVLRAWGEPKQKLFLGVKELWVYERNVAWRGFILWLYVPLPFIVPVGMNHTTVEFDKDAVVGFWNEYGNVICWGQVGERDYPCNPFLPPSFQGRSRP
jgi:hypothetical protein